MSRARSFFKRNTPLWLVLAIFGLAILFINPLREAAVDDDWTYALTVRHLLETGRYQLDRAAAANMPFLAYLSSLFVRLLGYSFSSLRISTLFLVALALIAFYCLAKEHGLDDAQAGLLALALLASPLVLRLGFSFMTDVAFLATLIIALYLYTRAIRLHSYPWMLLASMAGAAAILTRQFGVALIAGLFFLWVLSDGRRQKALFFLSGLALPVVAGLWQLSAGFLRPSWGAEFSVVNQSQYFANPGVVLAQAVWRPTVILQYLALFSLPLVFLALLAPVLDAFATLDARRRKLLLTVLMLVGVAVSTCTLIADWMGVGQSGLGLVQTLMVIGGLALSVVSWCLLRSAHESNQVAFRASDSRPLLQERVRTPEAAYPGEGVRSTYPREGVRSTYKRDAILLGVCAIYVVAGILYGYLGDLPLFMPYLPFCFGILYTAGRVARGILTLATSLGAILFARAFIVRYRDNHGWTRVPPSQRLIDWVTLPLFAWVLVQWSIGDRYLLVLLPLTLIVVGRHLGKWLRRYSMVMVLGCLATLVAFAMWTRGSLASAEALWRGGEFVLATGKQPNQVYNAYWGWNAYYRFGDYLAEFPNARVESTDDIFVSWLPRQREQAQFWVTETLDPPSDEKWEVLKEIPYRDILLREKRVYVVRRENQGRW
jgi:hypothetical protein